MTNSWYYQSILTGDTQTDLSPKDLNSLTLQPSDFFMVNQYVANGTCVPTNEIELRTYLNISPDTEIPAECTAMYPVYTNIKEHTLDYQQNIFPLVNTVTTNLWGFTNDTIETLKSVIPLLDSVRKDPSNTEGIADIKELLLSLVKGDPKTHLGGAEDYSNQAKVVSKKLTQFITATTADEAAVKAVHQSLENAIGSNSDEVKHFQDQVNDLNKTIAALTETLNTMATVSKWVLLIPMIGIIADAVLNKFSSKQRDQLNNLTNELNSTNAKIQRDNALNGLLQKLSTQSGTLADQAGQALQALSKIQGAWDSMSDAIDNIVKQENSYFVDPTFNAVLNAKINTAISSWTDIKGLVINFATAAHIQPPKSLATVGLLSSGPHEDISVPILKIDLVG